MVRKKLEGIEALVEKEEPISIQDITMLDWYAAFISMRQLGDFDPRNDKRKFAREVFDLADAMMAERSKR
jgi:hypothetical protein